MGKRLSAETVSLIDRVVAEYHRPDRIGLDPLGFPRRFPEPGDREVVALLAACLAWGRVQQIAQVMERLLERLGDHPAERMRSADEEDLKRITQGIIHRVATSADLARALDRIGGVLRDHGSLGALFRQGDRGDDPTVMTALTALSERLRDDGANATRGFKHLFPQPSLGSACKRWMLFLRWVVRPDDGVDLGLWEGISPSRLVIPLDTHIHRIALNLRLTRRRDASLRTALEVTEALRGWRPDDPVGCDFALSRLGIHQVCPTRVDPVVCEGCGLRSACRHGL
ncbi:TIGR02757 family protein [Candidatus Sumerlaeota bacterium]|nr:TIGR02757 family protein [Candidatus Sumerlaeota bacterium]